jgi:hypothetical protein
MATMSGPMLAMAVALAVGSVGGVAVADTGLDGLRLPHAPHGGLRLPWISNGAYDLHHAKPTEAQAMLEWLKLGGRGL